MDGRAGTNVDLGYAGGALASLLGITFGVPVVAFESPGDRLAAQRLHLPSPVRDSFVDVVWCIHAFSSRQPITSHMSTIRPTLLRWELVMASFLHVH